VRTIVRFFIENYLYLHVLMMTDWSSPIGFYSVHNLVVRLFSILSQKFRAPENCERVRNELTRKSPGFPFSLSSKEILNPQETGKV